MNGEPVTDQMRAAAEFLEALNRLYNYDDKRGSWSPVSLRYEAAYLDKGIDEDEIA